MQIAGAAKIACQQQLLLVAQSTMLSRTESDITQNTILVIRVIYQVSLTQPFITLCKLREYECWSQNRIRHYVEHNLYDSCNSNDSYSTACRIVQKSQPAQKFVILRNSIIFSISVTSHLAYFVILNSYSQSSHKCNFMM